MIDLHCHLLPGIDDGARDVADSVAMAQAASAGGVRAIVATPHVSGTYPNDPTTLAERVATLQAALADAAIPVKVYRGAEVASSMLTDLTDDQLAACTLGGGRYLLLEPPYSGPATFLDRLVFDLAVRGYHVVLAHPERIQAFQQDIDLLVKLVGQGAICSVTADSLAGRWGRHVQRFSDELLQRRLVHNIASDAHDATHRSPALRPVMDQIVARRPEIEDAISWLTDTVPSMILAGEVVRAEPPRVEAPRRVLGRLRRR